MCVSFSSFVATFSLAIWDAGVTDVAALALVIVAVGVTTAGVATTVVVYGPKVLSSVV